MENLFSFDQSFNERLLCVPDYQRGYAWGETQWRDLIDDIELLPGEKEHYTGTLVLYKKRDAVPVVDIEGTKYLSYDVVDGQQRLTTIVILLNAVLRQLLEFDTCFEVGQAIKKRYISTLNRNKDNIYKLKLNADCSRFFERRILVGDTAFPPAEIRSHALLAGARDYFETYLAEKREKLSKNAFEAYLRQLQDKIRHRLKLTVYEVSDASDVGVIFEVMNNRGKQLSELEKVKNYLLYLSSKLDVPENNLSEAINDAWSTMFKELQSGDPSSIDEDQLLRAHWLMAYDHNRKNWKGSKSIKERFDLRRYADSHSKLYHEIKQYVTTLEDSSRAYCDVSHPERTGAFSEFSTVPERRSEVVRWSKKLCRVNAMASFLPLLISARLKYVEDADSYLEFVKVCETYAFRVYRLLEKRSNAGQSRLFMLGAELFGGIKDASSAIEVIRSLMQGYCSNVEFNKQFDFETGRRNWYNWSGIKYFLYEYEEHLAGRDGVSINWSDIEQLSTDNTVEHILPQKPTGADGEYWLSRFTQDELTRYVHDIGNLTLTQHNREYWYYSFPRKRGGPGQGYCYANSNLRMERALWNVEEWNPTEIENRHSTISAWAKDRWFVAEPVIPPDVMLSEEDADDIDNGA